MIHKTLFIVQNNRTSAYFVPQSSILRKLERMITLNTYSSKNMTNANHSLHHLLLQALHKLYHLDIDLVASNKNNWNLKTFDKNKNKRRNLIGIGKNLIIETYFSLWYFISASVSWSRATNVRSIKTKTTCSSFFFQFLDLVRLLYNDHNQF